MELVRAGCQPWSLPLQGTVAWAGCLHQGGLRGAVPPSQSRDTGPCRDRKGGPVSCTQNTSPVLRTTGLLLSQQAQTLCFTFLPPDAVLTRRWALCGLVLQLPQQGRNWSQCYRPVFLWTGASKAWCSVMYVKQGKVDVGSRNSLPGPPEGWWSSFPRQGVRQARLRCPLGLLAPRAQH